jgi:hypothetical protein
MLQNRTALMALQEAQRNQEAEALYLQAVQQNPALLGLGGGGSMPQSPLASLSGQPAAGAMTQQTVGPGGPGATQTIPAYPDMSRFAGVSPASGGPMPPDVAAQVMPRVTPPQPTLAGLGGPQSNPIEALVRQNPRAGLLLMRQMQGQEDAQLKRQENRLIIGEKVMEYLGRTAPTIKSQADLDTWRTQLQSQGLHQYAAQLPQVYSAEAMQSIADRALSRKDSILLEQEDLKAQAAMLKAKREGISAPVTEYLGTLNKTWETATPQERAWAIQQAESAKERVSAMHGAGQIKETPQGMVRIGKSGDVEYLQAPGGGPLLGKPTEAEQKAGTYYDLAKSSQAITAEMEKKGFQPGFWEKLADQKLPYGISNYLTGEDYQKYKQAVGEFAAAWLRKTSGANVTQMEWDMTDQIYFPQPGNSKEVIEQKRQARERITRNLEEEARATGRTGGQAAPGGGQSSQALKPVTEMSRDELLAERDRLRKGGR